MDETDRCATESPARHCKSRSDSPANASDAELLRQFTSGEWKAFDILIDRYKLRLYSHIRRRVNDAHRSEDLTQEAFLRLFRAARSGAYTGQASVATWLFTIAGNCVTDHLRYHRRRQTGDIPAHANDSPEPSETASAKESDQRVRELLAGLPEEQRQVVEMKLLDELTFAEIAETLGCPVPTAKSRFVYAIRKLKEILSPDRRAEQ